MDVRTFVRRFVRHHIHRARNRARQNATPITRLEPRRHFAVDVSWGPISTEGALFVPGQTAAITANIRNFGATPVDANTFSVEFRYVNVGFRADAQNTGFFDPTAQTLLTAPVAQPLPSGAAGISVGFSIPFPVTHKLAVARQHLLARGAHQKKNRS